MTERQTVRTARLALLWGALTLAACRGDGGAGEAPRPLSVTPDRGPVSAPVDVVIRGENFHARVTTDFTGSGETGVDARFAVLLGQVPLDGVRLRADGSIAATVPPGLATGSYDLTVVDPEGRSGTLAAAYRVVPDAAAGPPVDSFRIDPLGPQQAMKPFAVAVTALDPQGQPVADFNGSVQLSDLTGTAVPGSAGLFVGGRWSGLVEIRAAHAADVLTASDGLGHSGQSAPFLVLPSPAAGLRFLTPARTGQAGACSGAGQPVVVGLFDAFGAPTQAEAAVPLALAAAPPVGFEVFADPSCAVPAAAVVGAGASSATFWFRGTRAGTVSLTASAPSLTPDSQSQTVVPAPPAAVAFVTTPQTVNAGVCSQAVTVEVQDAFGNPSPPGGAALELAASAGGFALFSDAACSVPASAAAVAPGATQGSFWFRGTTAQLVTVTAGSASLGLSAASQDEIVLSAGSATQLVILTPPQGVPAGTCSDLVTVQAQDSFGNPVQGAGAEQVALSAAPAAGMALFSDAACSVPAAVVQIGAGQSTTSFWFRGTVAGPVAITAGSATLTDAVQTESLTPAPPARLEFATASMNVAAGACSGLATVTVRDSFGNASPSGAPLPVALAAAPPAGFTFFADALCATPVAQVAVPAGGSTAAFAFRATRAGTETITASAAGLAPASQDETIRAATPDRLVITSAPQSVVAGACSGAVAVQARDPWDNPAPVPAAAAVALSATPVAGFGFFADAACTVPAASVPIPAGQPGATFFFAGTAAGSIAVTASAAGWTPASQSETVGPAAADHLVFLTAPQTVTAGACSGAVTVESRDVYENAAPPAGGAPVSLAGAPGAGLAFHAGAGCAGAAVASVAIAPGASSATFSFRDTAAGSVAVTASSAPLLPVTQTETVNPAAADHLVFTTAPQSRPAGACSAAVALESRDAYGNASPVAAATAIGLSASPGAGFTFYSDAGCTAAATGTAMGAGSSAAGFWFKGTAPGNVTATASVAGWSPSPAQDETITPAAADHVSFTTGPQTVTAGACSGVVTVETRDAYENASPVAAGTSIALAASPAAGFAFYSDAGCTAAAASATIPAGASSASFWFSGTAAGGVTVTASVPGLGPSPSQLEAVEPAAPDHLVFATPPQTRPAGACSAAVTLESQDAFGNVSRVAAATAVALSATPAAGFAFYSDAGCTLSTTSIAVVAGASSTGFWFKGTVPGGVTVTGTASGLSPSPAQVETVIPAAADHLVFASAPQAVAAGGCSGAVTVESRDALGNVSTVAAATAVALSASPAAGFAFYADAACTLAAGSATIPAGSSSAVFWFRGTAAGTVSVTASAAGWSPSPTQAETVAPAPPDRIAFASPPQTVTAGQCSAQVTLEARDQFGNPSAVAGATAVSLSASPAAGFAFFADAACSVPAISTTVAAGASTATFHFMGTAAGPVTATATPAGLAAATQVETVTAAATPSQLVFLTAPQAVTAGACSGTLTVETRDSYGNPQAPAGGATVSLSAPPAAGVQFHAGTDPTCAGAPVAAVSIPDGSATADFHFKGTAAGSTTVTAASAPLNPAAQVETVNPAAPDHLVFTTGAQTRQAGACSAAVTVQSQDAYGNVSAVTAATVVGLSASPAAGFAFYSDAGCTAAVASRTIAAGASAATFHFMGTAPGSVTVTASVAGWSPSPAQAETITAAAADHLVFTTGPQTVTAGACSGMVTVQSQDAYGNVSSVAAATTVDLSASPAAGFTFYSDAGCTAAAPSTTIAAGSSAASFWLKGTAPGGVTVTASVTGWSPSPAQVETVNPAAPDHLVFATGAQTRQAGACSAAVTVQSQDAYGNVSAVTATTVVDLSASPATGFGFYSDAGCTAAVTSRTIAAGSSTASFWFKGTAPGNVTVTASVAGWSPSPTQEETITPAAADHLVFTTGPQTVTAGACSAVVTVQSQDAYGNVSAVAVATAVGLSAAPAAGFGFYSDAGCTVAVASATIAAGSSAAGFWFKGTVSGSVTVTASVTGWSPSPTQVETVNPAAPDHLVFTTPAQTRQAGACSALVTLQSQDPFGNVSSVAAATAVDLSASPATGFGFYSDAACATAATTRTIAAGASTATFYFKGTAPGSVTVTASVAGWSPSPTQVETVNPAPPDHLAFGTASQTVTAGACSAAATVESRDPYGNVSPVSAATAVNLSAAPAAGFAFYSDPACTSAVALVTIPAAGTVATFYFRGTAAGSVTVAAAAAGMSPSPTQVETVVPAAPDRLVFTSAPQTVQAGACSAAATLLSRDAFGNTAPVSAATAVDLLAAPAAGFGFYADPACSVPAATASLAAGQSAASMWFRGTAVGAFTVTASVAGWTGSATQVETVNPGDPDHFAWDAFASPQGSNIPFAVTVRALDAFGNATPAFAGTAALTLSVSPPLAPAPVVTCTSGCIAGNTTGPFTAGVWTGSVAVGSPATPEPPGTPDRWLVATSGAVTGQSAAFALQGAKNPSPPVARFTTSPVVIRANQSVSFDASGSYDYETPVTLLEVSWDFQGAATAVQPPGAAPWTAWSTTKTASNTYTAAGTYTPRLAVRDEAGAVSYATVRVVVLAVGGSLCVVNTAADVDDGAGSCACTGAACGTDGSLSLAEALRLSADGTTITFAGPMTITGSGSYTISRNVQILAPPGVVLDSKSFLIQGGDAGQPLVLAGLEFTRQTTPIFVSSKRFVVFEDVYFHDLGTAGTPAVEDRGTVTLTRVRMANCASTCLLLTDSSNSDLLTVRHSDFKGNGGASTAIEARQCKSGRLALSVQSSAFSGFAQAVRVGAACPGFTAILNNTFEANGSGLVYAAGASPNHVLRNNVFTNQTAAAASCGGATFANRDYHVLFGNASDGCLAGDPNELAADPQYVFPAARDYRLQLGSPAVDSAVDLGLYLMPGFPAAPGPRFMGAGPDRGGRESF